MVGICIRLEWFELMESWKNDKTSSSNSGHGHKGNQEFYINSQQTLWEFKGWWLLGILYQGLISWGNRGIRKRFPWNRFHPGVFLLMKIGWFSLQNCSFWFMMAQKNVDFLVAASPQSSRKNTPRAFSGSWFTYQWFLALNAVRFRVFGVESRLWGCKVSRGGDDVLWLVNRQP